MSSKVTNAFATITEWILKIALLAVIVWLISIGLEKFDSATFHKKFVNYSIQMNRRAPIMLDGIKARIDSTFYTNSIFYVDMTIGDSIKANPPIFDIHAKTRELLSAYTGPDDFGNAVQTYRITTTYRFNDKKDFPLKAMNIDHRDYFK